MTSTERDNLETLDEDEAWGRVPAGEGNGEGETERVGDVECEVEAEVGAEVASMVKVNDGEEDRSVWGFVQDLHERGQ